MKKKKNHNSFKHKKDSKDQNSKTKDILEFFEVTEKNMSLTRLEILERRAIIAEIKAATLELRFKQIEKDDLLAKIDPEGKLAVIDRDIDEFRNVFVESTKALAWFNAAINTRLGTDGYCDVDDRGNWIQKAI